MCNVSSLDCAWHPHIMKPFELILFGIAQVVGKNFDKLHHSFKLMIYLQPRAQEISHLHQYSRKCLRICQTKCLRRCISKLARILVYWNGHVIGQSGHMSNLVYLLSFSARSQMSSTGKIGKKGKKKKSARKKKEPPPPPPVGPWIQKLHLLNNGIDAYGLGSTLGPVMCMKMFRK